MYIATDDFCLHRQTSTYLLELGPDRDCLAFIVKLLVEIHGVSVVYGICGDQDYFAQNRRPAYNDADIGILQLLDFVERRTAPRKLINSFQSWCYVNCLSFKAENKRKYLKRYL